MMKPVWVQLDVAIAAHQMLLAEHGGLVGVRDRGLLESALVRPQQLFSYELGSSIFDLAASYSYSLAKNHPFADGNKRIALMVAAIFLEINGYELDAPETDAVIIFQQLAAGEITEAALADWFERASIVL